MQDLLKKVGYDPTRGIPDELDEHLYAVAASELASSQARPGLLAKAYSDSEGDEQKARARYMKLRVAQLRREYEQASTVRPGRPAAKQPEQSEYTQQDLKDDTLWMLKAIVGSILLIVGLIAIVFQAG